MKRKHNTGIVILHYKACKTSLVPIWWTLNSNY